MLFELNTDRLVKRACVVCSLQCLIEEYGIEEHDRAEEFEVTLNFLLQQAAWLYERQLSQVRAQLRKVNNRPVSIGIPPMPNSVSGSGYVMTRGGSQGKEDCECTTT